MVNIYLNKYGAVMEACPEHFADVDGKTFLGTVHIAPSDGECDRCPEAIERRRRERVDKVKWALASPDFAYSRVLYTSPRSTGYFVIYHWRRGSPTGVGMAAECSLEMAEELGARPTQPPRVWR